MNECIDNHNNGKKLAFHQSESSYAYKLRSSSLSYCKLCICDNSLKTEKMKWHSSKVSQIPYPSKVLPPHSNKTVDPPVLLLGKASPKEC